MRRMLLGAALLIVMAAAVTALSVTPSPPERNAVHRPGVAPLFNQAGERIGWITLSFSAS